MQASKEEKIVRTEYGIPQVSETSRAKEYCHKLTHHGNDSLYREFRTLKPPHSLTTAKQFTTPKIHRNVLWGMYSRNSPSLFFASSPHAVPHGSSPSAHRCSTIVDVSSSSSELMFIFSAYKFLKRKIFNTTNGSESRVPVKREIISA